MDNRWKSNLINNPEILTEMFPLMTWLQELLNQQQNTQYLTAYSNPFQDRNLIVKTIITSVKKASTFASSLFSTTTEKGGGRHHKFFQPIVWQRPFCIICVLKLLLQATLSMRQKAAGSWVQNGQSWAMRLLCRLTTSDSQWWGSHSVNITGWDLASIFLNM